MAYESELTAAEVKAKAKDCGADIVGIAPMSRWEGTDKQHDPRYIFPDAKSMIVFGFRIPRGSLRGVDATDIEGRSISGTCIYFFLVEISDVISVRSLLYPFNNTPLT